MNKKELLDLIWNDEDVQRAIKEAVDMENDRQSWLEASGMA
jgi:hypothetical protein